MTDYQKLKNAAKSAWDEYDAIVEEDRKLSGGRYSPLYKERCAAHLKAQSLSVELYDVEVNLRIRKRSPEFEARRKGVTA